MITDLGVLEPDQRTCELTLTRLSPGVSVEQVRPPPAGTSQSPTRPPCRNPPTATELRVLRELKATIGAEA
ncbi:hypothetical protein GCM10020366_69740 [Saccharopolyspora gregorii]|uniref:Uncharacterized protein n=1 Tax=Saccharopolyspora gregorii TaxID=33914 RepID=A0ABP6S2K2_9PSEU